MRSPRSPATIRIHTDPGKQLLLGPLVPIGPVVQLLIHPRQQRHGAIIQRIRQRLRLGALLDEIPASLDAEPRRARQPRLLLRRVRRERVLQGQQRVRGERGRGRDHEVDVRGFAGGGVQVADRARYEEAPVAALGHVLVVAEREHQFVARLGVLFGGEAAGLDAGGEAVVGEGGRDDVECWAGGVGEEGEDGEGFYKGAGPWGWMLDVVRLEGWMGGLAAVDEEQRDGVLDWALLPDEMYI